MKSLIILGSTGSIGTQALEVCRRDGYKVVALAAGSNIGLLEAQAREFKVKAVAVFNEEKANELKIKLFDSYTREWAEFVFNNRDENQQFQHDYDVVYGPIADDYIGLQIRDFKRNNITFEQFLQRIQYHKGITFQYAFCTQKGIEKLIRL